MAGFLKFIASILPSLIGFFKAIGAREERARITREQQEEADAMREDFDQIGSDGRDLDTALERLRQKHRRGDVS